VLSPSKIYRAFFSFTYLRGAALHAMHGLHQALTVVEDSILRCSGEEVHNIGIIPIGDDTSVWELGAK
jgi:hypothetical protein